MKKLIVGALAIYGGVKLGEKLLKKYREPIAEWVGKKAKKAVSDFMDDIFGIDKTSKPVKPVKPEPSKPWREKVDYSKTKVNYSKTHNVKVVMPTSMDYMTVDNLTFADAHGILAELCNKLEIYGEATTIDLENSTYSVSMAMPAKCLGYGWTDLDDAYICKLACGLYGLVLPNMKKL